MNKENLLQMTTKEIETFMYSKKLNNFQHKFKL